MIGEPVNDRQCLDGITDVIRALITGGDIEIRELAERHATTKALVKWIRSLPQRDDEGDPADGPRIHTCNPPQRLRIPALDANCVERAASYIAIAELIDPGPVRQLATVDTLGGPHTFPVENAEPVVLDPKVTRNALSGGLYRNAPAPVRLTPTEAIDWIVEIAAESMAAIRGGRELLARARGAMFALLDGTAISDDDVVDVALVLGIAEREAREYGPTGETVVLTAAEVLAELDAVTFRNARRHGWRVGHYRVRPHPTTVAVANVTGRVASRAAAAAARAYLGSLGVSPTLLEDLEVELRREGLTLGALGRRPRPGAETMAAEAMKKAG